MGKEGKAKRTVREGIFTFKVIRISLRRQKMMKEEITNVKEERRG